LGKSFFCGKKAKQKLEKKGRQRQLNEEKYIFIQIPFAFPCSFLSHEYVALASSLLPQPGFPLFGKIKYHPNHSSLCCLITHYMKTGRISPCTVMSNST
jgi:hypothetical protein